MEILQQQFPQCTAEIWDEMQFSLRSIVARRPPSLSHIISKETFSPTCRRIKTWPVNRFPLKKPINAYIQDKIRTSWSKRPKYWPNKTTVPLNEVYRTKRICYNQTHCLGWPSWRISAGLLHPVVGCQVVTKAPVLFYFNAFCRLLTLASFFKTKAVYLYFLFFSNTVEEKTTTKCYSCMHACISKKDILFDALKWFHVSESY